MSNHQSPMKRWLSVREAATYLGCHRTVLDHDRLNGDKGIPFSRLGGRHIRYNVADLEAYMAASRTTPAPGQ